MGIPRNVNPAELVNLSVYLSAKSNIKDPRNLSETQTICECLDYLFQGKYARVADILSMRFVAIERAISDKDEWKEARKYELRREVCSTLCGSSL